MNVYARFNEIPSMTLKSHGQTDNVKTVYSPTHTVCGGIKIIGSISTVVAFPRTS